MNSSYRKIAILILIITLMISGVCNGYSQTIVVRSIQELEDVIIDQMKNYQEDIDIKYRGNVKNLADNFEKLFDKALEKDPTMYGSLNQVTWEIKCSLFSASIKINAKYHTTKFQDEKADKKVSEIISQIITDNMTDYQKVKAVNDYIVLNSKYSQDTAGSPYSAYTLLSEGKGVCQAYALLTYKFMNQLNIPCSYVTGTAGIDGKEIPHAWNLVKVDGRWYNLDVTWNDPIPDRKGRVSYDYFLISDSEISKNHKRDVASINSGERPVVKYKVVNEDLRVIVFGIVCIVSMVVLVVLIFRKLFFKDR